MTIPAPTSLSAGTTISDIVGRETLVVFIVHGTKKFRDRVPPTDAPAPEQPMTTALGDWYATVLFWRAQVTTRRRP